MSVTLTLESVTSDYASADTAGKGKIRAAVQRKIDDSLRAGDFDSVQAWFTVKENLVTVKVKTEIDVTAAWADKIILARETLAWLEVRVASLADIDGERLAEILADPTSVTHDLGEKAKAAASKITVSTERAESSDLQADLDAGTWTVGQFYRVSEIAKQVTSGGGAISARLFPGEGKTCTLQGWEPVDATATHPKGAVYLGR